MLSRFTVKSNSLTLAKWILYGAKQWLTLIYDRMKTHLVARDILHADETTLQVLKEPGRSATSTSYLWLHRTGCQGPSIVLYDYQTTRASKHPVRSWPTLKAILKWMDMQGIMRLKT